MNLKQVKTRKYSPTIVEKNTCRHIWAMKTELALSNPSTPNETVDMDHSNYSSCWLLERDTPMTMPSYATTQE
ncbi:lachesin X2 [Biomphalaria glabrata]|nr:lachesin X2 [Biomphalaria glabrata]